MIVFSAVTPHSPLLLESINKDQISRVQETRDAMKHLAEDLYAVRPDVILHISEHPTGFSDTFSINLSDPFLFDLKEFGDLGFEKKFRPAVVLTDHLQRSLRKVDQPVTLTTDTALHYASAVPLALLTEKLPNVRLLPITYSDLSPKAHFLFGEAMKDVLMKSNLRIAVIASGDLSHSLTENSPAGFNEAGEKFDAKIQEIMSTKNTAGLLNIDPALIVSAHETLYRPFCMLMGIIDRIATVTQILSYEAPFGVGYLVSEFRIK